MDPLEPGRGLADILPESLVAAGAEGVMLNHVEKPLTLGVLKKTIERAKEVGLTTIVCADSIVEASMIAKLDPDIIVAEPSELIGTGLTSGPEYVEAASRGVKEVNPDILVLTAAGISTGQDVYNTIIAGADATGSSSGVAKAADRAAMVDEMIAAVEAGASLGITKLRITGGEPLVKRNIITLCARAAKVEGIREVAITTNGVLLPRLAKGLRAVGVSRVNLSLDTLKPDKYARITRIGTLSSALAGLDAALNAGFDKVKINAVLIGGFNDDEIETLAALTLRYPVDVRFIELMPMLDHPEFGPEAFIPCAAVLEKLPQAVPVPQDGGVARLYRLPGAQGNIGLISPVSAHFCAACNRIRLTADGKLKPCLHAAEEVSLKGLNAAQMRETMQRVIYQKPFRHAELSATLHSQAGRNMNQIGG